MLSLELGWICKLIGGLFISHLQKLLLPVFKANNINQLISFTLEISVITPGNVTVLWSDELQLEIPSDTFNFPLPCDVIHLTVLKIRVEVSLSK